MSTVVIKRPPLEWFREEIPVARWSGSGPYTLQINVDYITANTIVDASLDSTITNLTSQLNVSSGNGYILLSTDTLPSGQINVTIMPNGESRIVKTEVLADCYSSSQVDSLVNPLKNKIGTTNISGIADGTLTGAVNEINAELDEKINIDDVIDNLTSTLTNKPLSASMGKALNDTIKQARGINKTFSATSITDFLSQILDDVLSVGVGSYVAGYTWQGYYACTVTASVINATRAVIIVTPQPANIPKVFVAEFNNNSKTYKEIITSPIDTIEYVDGNYTNKDSHIENFTARKSGKIISISFSLTSGLTNETILFNIPESLKPVGVNYIGPLFIGSSGTMYTGGGAWMEISYRDRVTYYGNTTTERLWCSMTYICV